MENNISNILIQQCVKGDRRAESELYRLLYRALIGVCWRYAEDKEQAVEFMNLGFVRILMNLKKYRIEVPFDMWSRRVLINAIINELRKNKKWKDNTVRGMEIGLVDKSFIDDISDHQKEMLDLIKDKSVNLPPMTRRVFNMYAIDGYSHTEISDMLGISDGTSAWHYSEAKKRIRQMMGLDITKG